MISSRPPNAGCARGTSRGPTSTGRARAKPGRRRPSMSRRAAWRIWPPGSRHEVAAGLAGIGLAPTLAVYLAAWVVLGAGMGTGLYDAVFAALGKIYGKEARTPITNLTLFGGFASTVCW